MTKHIKKVHKGIIWVIGVVFAFVGSLFVGNQYKVASEELFEGKSFNIVSSAYADSSACSSCGGTPSYISPGPPTPRPGAGPQFFACGGACTPGEETSPPSPSPSSSGCACSGAGACSQSPSPSPSPSPPSSSNPSPVPSCCCIGEETKMYIKDKGEVSVKDVYPGDFIKNIHNEWVKIFRVVKHNGASAPISSYVGVRYTLDNNNAIILFNHTVAYSEDGLTFKWRLTEDKELENIKIGGYFLSEDKRPVQIMDIEYDVSIPLYNIETLSNEYIGSYIGGGIYMGRIDILTYRHIFGKDSEITTSIQSPLVAHSIHNHNIINKVYENVL